MQWRNIVNTNVRGSTLTVIRKENKSKTSLKYIIKRIAHVLWLNKIFIQLGLCFLSPRQCLGQKTHDLLAKSISNDKPWVILYLSESMRKYVMPLMN